MGTIQTDEYVLGRDIFASMRLDLQHFLFKMHYGFILHPKIPVSPDMKIAEVGTGTGIWAVDAAAELPSTVKIDAYDISSGQFPPKSLWPSNLTFGTLDSFAEVPEHLVGRYDVVHMRLWCCIIKNNDPSNLIKHVMRLLKPGGYIQWEDAWLAGTTAVGKAAEAYLPIAMSTFNALGFKFDWVRDIAHHVENGGFQVLQSAVATPIPAVIPLITKTYLSGFLELQKSAYQLAPSTLPVESESTAKLFATMEGTKNGESWYWSPVNIVAQKPFDK